MKSFAVFGIIVVLLASTDVACEEDPCRQLDFRAALSFNGKKLINHVIRTINSIANDFCGAQCFMEANCVSYNVISSGSPSIADCELNNSTHNEHPDDLAPCSKCIYRGAKNACGKKPCKNNATCQAGFTNKGYRCVCPTEFTGQDCLDDVDECVTAKHKCHVNAVCANTHGSHDCTCKVGYTGDGYNCTDINECATQVNPCDANAVCNNTYGSYNCHCDNGFVKNGADCTDIDECSDGTHKCDVNATCDNTPGSYDCLCKPGYTGDGRNCTDIDECASRNNDCVNGGAINCTNTEGSYSCSCQPGYVWNGTYCQDFDECTSNPCKNNGNCTDLLNGYNCSCAPGFNGTNCEEDTIDECESNPCLNNGTCTDLVNDYNCSCLSVFYGRRCEIEFFITSTILSSNYKYLNHLAQFLAPAPAVGNHSTWQLCYEAPNGGNPWSASDFHTKCDGKRDTLVIIRKGQYVFGGYTDIPWESPAIGFVSGLTPNAFIFSLDNAEGLTPFKIKVKDEQTTAVISYTPYGPMFHQKVFITGSGDGSQAELGGSYPAPPGILEEKKKTILAGTNSFKPDKVEVFYLG